MTITPLIAVHMTAALLAIATGPVALWARKGAIQRPKLHRAFGYAWVTLMVITAVSALFIKAEIMPLVAGMGPIHVLSFATLGGLILSFWYLSKGNIAGHRKTMQGLYIGACLVAGAFTLLPGRFLGDLLWVQWLGLLQPGAARPSGQPMIALILTNTPLWVWGLLAALVALGLSQTRARSATLARVTLMPLGLVAFSVMGLVGDLGAKPAVLGTWLAAAAVSALLVMRTALPMGTHFDAAQRRFQLPGSWVPLALILAIFFIKYAVGVSLGLSPALRADTGFAAAVAALSGLSSGLFAGRTARLLRLTRQPATHRTTPATPLFNT